MIGFVGRSAYDGSSYRYVLQSAHNIGITSQYSSIDLVQSTHFPIELTLIVMRTWIYAATRKVGRVLKTILDFRGRHRSTIIPTQSKAISGCCPPHALKYPLELIVQFPFKPAKQQRQSVSRRAQLFIIARIKWTPSTYVCCVKNTYSTCEDNWWSS